MRKRRSGHSLHIRSDWAAGSASLIEQHFRQVVLVEKAGAKRILAHRADGARDNERSRLRPRSQRELYALHRFDGRKRDGENDRGVRPVDPWQPSVFLLIFTLSRCESRRMIPLG